MPKCYLWKRENRQPNQPIFFSQLEEASHSSAIVLAWPIFQPSGAEEAHRKWPERRSELASCSEKREQGKGGPSKDLRAVAQVCRAA